LKASKLEQLLKAFNSSVLRIKDAILTIRSLELQPFISDQYASSLPAASSHLVYNSIQSGLIRNLGKPLAKFLLSRPTSFTECVTLARIKFDKYYNHKAHHLLEKFPEDAKTYNGTAFWQLPKRRPTPLTFSLKDPLHVQFVWSFARLLAHQMGIKYPQADDHHSAATLLEEYLSDFTLQPYTTSDKEILTDPSIRRKPDAKSGKLNLPTLLQLINSIEAKYSKAKDDQLICIPAHFEKDDEVLGHVDFVDAAANLRALMYGLPLTPRHEVKRIAGRIMPAIATTTAVVAGLVCVEALKFFAFLSPPNHPHDPLPTALLEVARNYFVNLGAPTIYSIRPSPCRLQSLPNGVTVSTWNPWTLPIPHDAPQFTLSDLITTLQERFGLSASLISQQSRVLYMEDFNFYNQKLGWSLLSLLSYDPEDSYVDLIVTYHSGGVDVEAPRLRIILPSPSVSGTSS
uniref:UBA_e1_C domain-containing protein n=1 Tax=Schistocephalus solidus TaxID=70667 RepID=A0A183T6K7_SCHSO